MKVPTPLQPTETGGGRRIVVALVVATAAAAVTAGVALNERQPAERALPRAEAGPARGAEQIPVAAATRDGPVAEAESTTAGDAPETADARSDLSVPAAAKALEGASDGAGAPAPTF